MQARGCSEGYELAIADDRPWRDLRWVIAAAATTPALARPLAYEATAAGDARASPLA